MPEGRKIDLLVNAPAQSLREFLYAVANTGDLVSDTHLNGFLNQLGFLAYHNGTVVEFKDMEIGDFVTMDQEDIKDKFSQLIKRTRIDSLKLGNRRYPLDKTMAAFMSLLKEVKVQIIAQHQYDIPDIIENQQDPIKSLNYSKFVASLKNAVAANVRPVTPLSALPEILDKIPGVRRCFRTDADRTQAIEKITAILSTRPGNRGDTVGSAFNGIFQINSKKLCGSQACELIFDMLSAAMLNQRPPTQGLS